MKRVVYLARNQPGQLLERGDSSRPIREARQNTPGIMLLTKIATIDGVQQRAPYT